MQSFPKIIAVLKQVVFRTQTHLLLAFIFSVLIFLVQYSQVIIEVLDADANLPPGTSSELFSVQVQKALQNLSEKPAADTIITALIWGGVGVGLYLGYVFVRNTLITVQNEVEYDLEQLKEPPNTTVRRRLYEKLLGAIGLVFYIVLWCGILVPYFMTMLGIFVFSGMSFYQAHFLVIGILGLAITMYVGLAALYFAIKYEEELLWSEPE